MTAEDRLSSVLEQHYTPKQIAARLNKSDDWVRRNFESERGVKIHGAQHRRGKRRYATMLIPESVLLRVLRQMEV